MTKKEQPPRDACEICCKQRKLTDLRVYQSHVDGSEWFVCRWCERWRALPAELSEDVERGYGVGK